MTAQLIDGTAIAQKVRDGVKEKVAKRIAEGKSQPGLATVLVGERIDSATYVSMKQKACADLGMTSYHHPLPADITQEDLEKLIKELNADPKVNGILVQLPLPSHLDEERVLQLISIEKDVDGFSPINLGRLAQKGREPLFVPCTPYGCIYLLEQAGVNIDSNTPGPVLSFAPTSVEQRDMLSRALLSHHIYPPLIRYPGGPAIGYFRFAISSEHTPEQLTAVANALTVIKEFTEREG